MAEQERTETGHRNPMREFQRGQRGREKWGVQMRTSTSTILEEAESSCQTELVSVIQLHTLWASKTFHQASWIKGSPALSYILFPTTAVEL